MTQLFYGSEITITRYIIVEYVLYNLYYSMRRVLAPSWKKPTNVIHSSSAAMPALDILCMKSVLLTSTFTYLCNISQCIEQHSLWFVAQRLTKFCSATKGGDANSSSDHCHLNEHAIPDMNFAIPQALIINYEWLKIINYLRDCFSTFDSLFYLYSILNWKKFLNSITKPKLGHFRWKYLCK